MLWDFFSVVWYVSNIYLFEVLGEVYMKIIKISICFFAGIMLLMGLFMIVNGSLESFPTEEQIEKVRLVGIALVAVGISIESVILILFCKSKKKDKI